MAQNAPSAATATLTTLAVVVVAYYLSYVVYILLLGFAGVVLAVLLDAITTGLQRFLPGGRPTGLVGMAVVVGVSLTLAGLLVVPPVVAQIPQLVQDLPEAWNALQQRLQRHDLLQPVMSQVGNPGRWLQNSVLLGQITGVVSNAFDFIFNLVVIAFLGIYFAASPESHRSAVIAPLRQQRRAEVGALLAEIGQKLRYWLAGRAVSMTTVGVTTGLGLWLLGVRLAFSLGFLAGMFSFVPYLGPIVAVVPALLIAFSQSAALAGMTALLYLAIQTLESYVLTPLVQERAVSLPPAWLLIAQLFGGLFGGVLGVVFAAPLTIAGATAIGASSPRDH